MGKRSIEKECLWRGIVARFQRSGMTVRGFCKGEQVKEYQFFAWRRELKRRDAALTNRQGSAACEAGIGDAQTASQNDHRRTGRKALAHSIADSHAHTVHTMAAGSAAFTALHVVPSPPANPSSIEIILGAPRRVAVAPGFDPEALTQVLAVLEGRPC